MSHDCHCFVSCYKTHTFGSLFTRCRTHCACHTRCCWNVQKWSEQVVLLLWLGHVLCATTPEHFQHLNFQKCSDNGVLCTFWLRNVLRATSPCTFSASQPPKVARDRQFLTLLTSKCASRQTAVHFFNISTSKSAEPAVFLHFDFQMCFGTTAPCTFWTSQLPKLLQVWGVFSILTSKSASHHNGVQFFICHLTRLLRTCCFSEPTFRASGAPRHRFATFLPFRAPSSSFFWLFLFSSLLWYSFFFLLLFFSSLLFSSLLWLFRRLLFPSVHIMSEVWLLNFLR